MMFMSMKYLPSIEGYSGLGCVLFQLVEGTCSERVCTNETCLPSFPRVVEGQLCVCVCETNMAANVERRDTEPAHTCVIVVARIRYRRTGFNCVV